MDERIIEDLNENQESLYEMLEDSFANNESPFRKHVGQDSAKVNSVKGRYKLIKEMVCDIIGREI
jgi:hypothetical protein